MKAIFYADPTTHYFKGSNIVADDYKLQANETFEEPNVKTEPAKLVGTSWQDATPEEHEAWVKAQQGEALPATPSAGEQALNALGLQVASLTAENKQLKQSNGQLKQSMNVLGLQVAQAIAKDNKENGGN